MERTFILIDCIGRGGAEKIAVTLANELADQGQDVHLLILRRNIGYALSEHVHLHVMSDLQFAKGYAYSVLEVWRGFWWAWRVLKEESGCTPRVLVSHLTRSNIINVLLGLFTRDHRAICVSHNSVGFYRDRGILRRLLLTAQGLLFPLAHRTVCVSKRMAADYRRLCLFRKQSIVTIYNPIQIARTSPQTSDHTTAGATVNIAMIGRLHPVKRHDLAVQAMALLKAAGRRHYVLHIAGDGPEEERVRQLIDSAAVGDCVVMHGWIDDTGPILRECSLSLLCSDTEGFPNSIVESLAFGLPVVATDCVSGPRELLAPDHDPEREIAFQGGVYPVQHGVLVHLGDARALAVAIEHQVTRPDQLQQRAACIEFAQQFDAPHVARQYRHLVEAEAR